MNPVRNEDRRTTRVACPCCAHKPFRYLGWFKRHMLTEHPETAWTARFLADRIGEQRNAKKLCSAISREFIHAVLDVAYPALTSAKKDENKEYYNLNKANLKANKLLWLKALTL